MKRFFPSTGQSQGDVTHAGVEKFPGSAHLQSLRVEELTFRSHKSFAVARLVAIYVVVSGAWILLSDHLVAAFVRDPRTAQHVQTYKGWFFVVVTGVLLGCLARRDLKRLEDAGVVLRESIDELKLAEQRMADARNYNQTILDASPVGLITYKATGEVVSANEAAAQIIGATLEQVRAQSFRELESWRHYGLLEAAEKALVGSGNCTHRGDEMIRRIERNSKSALVTPRSYWYAHTATKSTLLGSASGVSVAAIATA